MNKRKILIALLALGIGLPYQAPLLVDEALDQYIFGESTAVTINNQSYQVKDIKPVPELLKNTNAKTLNSKLLKQQNLKLLLELEPCTEPLYVKLKEYKRKSDRIMERRTYEFDGVVTDPGTIKALEQLYSNPVRSGRFFHTWVCVDPVRENAAYTKNSKWNSCYWAAVESVEHKDVLYAKLQTKINAYGEAYGALHPTSRWKVWKRTEPVSPQLIKCLYDYANMPCININPPTEPIVLSEPFKKALAEWYLARETLHRQYWDMAGARSLIAEKVIMPNFPKLLNNTVKVWEARKALIDLNQGEVKPLYFLRSCRSDIYTEKYDESLDAEENWVEDLKLKRLSLS